MNSRILTLKEMNSHEAVAGPWLGEQDSVPRAELYSSIFRPFNQAATSVGSRPGEIGYQTWSAFPFSDRERNPL